MTSLLEWTGYPLVDVGAAGVAAFVDKRRISDVSVEDGGRVADWIGSNYPHEPFKSFLTSVFPNSGYVNPTMAQTKRDAFVQTYLRAFERPELEGARPCAFCGRPSATQAFRQHIPLTMGEDLVNFVPNGVSGLPVCGACLLCIQAVPLAAVRCAGRLLIVHSSDPSLTLQFARAFLDENRRQLALVSQLPEAERKIAGRKHAKTLLLTELGTLEQGRRDAAEDNAAPASLTVYHLTNYGANADIAIYHLPAELMDFLRTVWSASYAQAWGRLVNAEWDDRTEGADRRNRLMEAIFDLPGEGSRFLRRFLLRRGGLANAQGEAGSSIDLISWPITELFLRKVVDMDQERIRAIERLGDRIAQYIEAENDRRLFQGLLGTHGYRYLRLRLIKASLDSVKTKGEPLITLDEFITVFERGEEFPRVDWSLARDLVLIRTIEGLKGWLRKESQVLEEAIEDVESAGEETGTVDRAPSTQSALS